MYKYTTRSQSDPNGIKGGLGFNDLKAATDFANKMNQSRLKYPEKHNTDFWKSMPEEYFVYQYNTDIKIS